MPVIRSGAAASRQIGARPARDQEQATRSQSIFILWAFLISRKARKIWLPISAGKNRRWQHVESKISR